MTRWRIHGRLLVVLSLMAAAFALAAPEVAAHPEDCSPHAGETDEHDHSYCISDEEIAGYDDSGANLAPGQMANTRNVHLVANLPKSGPFAGEAQFGSDLAFWGKYAFQGNYNGVQITDISERDDPRIVSQIYCPGSQNDVSVWKGLLFTSTDSSRNHSGCENNVPQSATNPASWEGIRIFDVSNPANPSMITAVETDCGSHTHTLVPDEANGRVLLYVQSYAPAANQPDCQPPHDKISIVAVPLAAPQLAHVAAEPVLFPDGGYPGDSYTRATSGCHDITVYPALDLAAGACMGEGIILDISNPMNPQVLSKIFDSNFAFWHSATFTNDGSKVVFTDELGGGGAPTCNPTVGPERGADAIYDISDPTNPVFLSYFKIDRTQSNTENCVAHNGNFLPIAGKDIYVQSWYQGGVSVVDFTNAQNPKEIGFLDRGPLSDTQLILGGSWSSYWYNGHIFSNDIQKGLDVIALADPIRAGRLPKLPYLNAQTQEPLR
ncbi:MAG TPA: hypothetical protein VHJ34_01820 [Actinomycetota bacterium]|nr:hypothetical protein [Actinomycetota bacterium]